MFNEYPYTNFHELNADWLVNTMKKLSNEWDEFHKQLTAEFEEFKNSMNGEWEQFESSLTQAWEKYKNDTNTALEKWKTQTTQGLETWKTQTAEELNGSYNTFTTQVNNAISAFKNEINAKVQGQDTKITALEHKVDTFIESLDISTEVDRAFRELVNEGYVTQLLSKTKNIAALIPDWTTISCDQYKSGGYTVLLDRKSFALNNKISTSSQKNLTNSLKVAETIFKGEPFVAVVFMNGADYTAADGVDDDYIYNFTTSEHCVGLIVVPSSIFVKSNWVSSPALLMEHYKRKTPNFLFAKNALTLFSDPSQYSYVQNRWVADKGELLCSLLGAAAINVVKYLDVRPELLYPKDINFTLSGSTDHPFGKIIRGESESSNRNLSVLVRVVYSRKTISFRFLGFDNKSNITDTFDSDTQKGVRFIATWNFPGLNDNMTFPASIWLTNKLGSSQIFDTEIPMQVGITGADSTYPSLKGKLLSWLSPLFDTNFNSGVNASIFKQAFVTDFNFHTF